MGMKNLTLKEANDQVSKIVKMLRNGTLTDETFSLLEIALKQLQKDTYKLGLKEASLNEPLNDSTQIEPNYSDMVSLISNFKY
jgi:hypothetical protein